MIMLGGGGAGGLIHMIEFPPFLDRLFTIEPKYTNAKVSSR